MYLHDVLQNYNVCEDRDIVFYFPVHHDSCPCDDVYHEYQGNQKKSKTLAFEMDQKTHLKRFKKKQYG